MIVWDETLRVGHPTIDAEHKKLIDIINEFHRKSQFGEDSIVLHQTLKSLLEYGRKHFAAEERIQKECMYPYAEMHAKEHELLILQVTEMARKYFVERREIVDEKALREMNVFLRHWLVNHIQKFDTNMSGWVAKADAPEGGGAAG